MSLCLHHNMGCTTIFSAYAPTQVASSEDKDEFYLLLEEALRKSPTSDSLLILGDFNARVGCNSAAWESVLGPHSIGSMNENGQRLLEFCANHKMCIPSTFFKGTVKSKVTWMHPRSKHWHQLDHILVQRQHLKLVTHCRSLHSANCNNSDHTLVRCKVKLQPKKLHYTKPKPNAAIDTTATKFNDKVAHFQELLSAVSFLTSTRGKC